ncbi:outer membrane lipoprotein carrier protein LolA [Streptomyces sp. NPDC014733]|uniref:LolA family protein n=1 Tax=Streptomyces sp. NPDC014733 TaxID=3364885 RepID=UPI003701CD0A
MPRNEPTDATAGRPVPEGDVPVKRRKAVRYGVPVAVAGVVAATVGLVPAFAGSGSPDLPKLTAQQLLAKMAGSDTQQLSGTVRVTTDLGLPSLPGAGGALPGLGGAGGSGEGDGGAPQSPRNKLMELASGAHTLRVAADGPDRQRVTFVDGRAEYSLIHDGDRSWAYDGGSNTAVRSERPKGAAHAPRPGAGLPRDLAGATPQELARQALKAAGDTTSVTVGSTEKVAGRDAYQLVLTPKQSGSTIGSVRIAVDAANGVPLKFSLLPRSGGAPVVDAGFTTVDFARPAASSFAPPRGAKIVDGAQLHPGGKGHGSQGPHGSKGFEGFKEFRGEKGRQNTTGPHGVTVLGKGWTGVAVLKGGGSLPTGKGGAAAFLDSLGEKVHGDFGSGHVFSTRLVNALMTDDGTVYVGAVDRQTLVKTANAARTAAR